ncbi:MAG: DHH family phosphoesterase, partial [Alphaproteobacteria bacterium]|nr:DHH family phosphoesterase [Alphaproteobacteria bacterium]
MARQHAAFAEPGQRERAAALIAERCAVPDLVARLLLARGIGPDEAAGFLAPSLKAELPDPAHLKGMEAAVDRLARAVLRGETVAIFGDYDVDGATSAALLQGYLQDVGATVRVYVPDRIAEGYGPNAPALLRLQAEGAAVAVTVDCGITGFDALEAAAEAGLDVIVVDHHAAEPRLP